MFAATNGYVDDIDLEQVGAFEEALHQHFKAQHADLLQKLETGKWKELEAAVQAGVEEFKKGYGQRTAANQ